MSNKGLLLTHDLMAKRHQWDGHAYNMSQSAAADWEIQ